MKYTLHVPSEQYGYIEAELEGTEVEAVGAYHKLLDEIKKHQPLKLEGFIPEAGVCATCGATLEIHPAGVSKTKKDKQGNPLKYGTFKTCPNKCYQPKK